MANEAHTNFSKWRDRWIRVQLHLKKCCKWSQFIWAVWQMKQDTNLSDQQSRWSRMPSSSKINAWIWTRKCTTKNLFGWVALDRISFHLEFMQLLLHFIDFFQQSNAIVVGTGELFACQLVAVFNWIKLCLQVWLILLVPAISSMLLKWTSSSSSFVNCWDQ